MAGNFAQWPKRSPGETCPRRPGFRGPRARVVPTGISVPSTYATCVRTSHSPPNKRKRHWSAFVFPLRGFFWGSSPLPREMPLPSVPPPPPPPPNNTRPRSPGGSRFPGMKTPLGKIKTAELPRPNADNPPSAGKNLLARVFPLSPRKENSYRKKKRFRRLPGPRCLGSRPGVRFSPKSPPCKNFFFFSNGPPLGGWVEIRSRPG